MEVCLFWVFPCVLR